MYKRILIPVDGGSCSEQTVRWGLDFAAAVGAEVTFLHVVEVTTNMLSKLPTSALYLGDLIRDMREAGKAILADARLEAKAAGVGCDAYMLEDKQPAQAILEAEKSHHLTLMATHSRRGLDRLFLGSVTEAVLRLSEKPHLILRCPDDTSPLPAQVSFKRLLLPTDGSACSGHALTEGLKLAKVLGAEVTFLHALEVPVTVYTMPESMVYEPGIREEVQRTAQAILEKAHREATEMGVKASSHLADTAHLRPDQVIVNAEAEIDLTVMGTHGRRGFNRVLLGSVTERVLRRSVAPHLVVRCPG